MNNIKQDLERHFMLTSLAKHKHIPCMEINWVHRTKTSFRHGNLKMKFRRYSYVDGISSMDTIVKTGRYFSHGCTQ